MTRRLPALEFALACLLAPSLALAEDAAGGAASPTATPAPIEAIDLPEPQAEDPRFSIPVADDFASEPVSDGTTFLLGAGVPRARGSRPSNRDALRMISVPAGCLAIGGAAWSGVSMHTGDAGTPALEMGAGYAGAWAGAIASVGTIYLFDRDSLDVDPDRPIGGLGVPMAVSAAAVPLVAGAATFYAGEELEGRSRNRDEALAAAIAGAALGEALVSFAAWKLDTPGAQGPMLVAFVPIGVGATLGYRIARGGGEREKPLMRAPVMFVVRF